MNWVDIIIVLVMAYQVYAGWERGFTLLLANLGSFLISLWLSIHYHAAVGNFFVAKFGFASQWKDVLGYIVVAFITQSIVEGALIYAMRWIPKKIETSKINHYLGAVVSFFNSGIILSFFLLLVLALPFRGTVKQDVGASAIARFLVVASERYGGSLESSLEDVARSAVKFLTVEPGSKERIILDIPSTSVSLSVDSVSETQMVALINAVRATLGVSSLRVDASISEVARDKSRDMFERRYFSHEDLDGRNASDRMTTAHVAFTFVGENIAYAPNVHVAHEGLMNSSGHRANIVESRFHRIGVGVIDGGIYGKMFTEIFAD